MQEEVSAYLINEINNNLIPILKEFIEIKNTSSAFDPKWQTDHLNNEVCELAINWAIK